MGRLLTIIRKEFIHIRRDPRTLTIMFLLPVIQMFLLGYAATTNVEHLPTAVLDRDRTARSRALIDAYRASGYFDIAYYVRSEEALLALLDGGQVRAGMIIPPGYERDLAKGRQAQVAFLIDGSDPNVANTAFAAAQSVGQAQSVKVALRALSGKASQLPGIEVRPRVLYNPEMKSSSFMIPALIGIILQYLTTLLTALAIVREREQGTIEQLIVTPIRPWELVVGKVVPYVAVAFWDLGEVLLVGMFWFGVPVRGSIPVLLALAVLFLLTSLGIGLLISAAAHTQQEAIFLTFLILLPSIFLSGFFFPLEAMPLFLQLISYVIPLRYFLVIVRSIVLKGVGLATLTDEVIALVIFGFVIMLAATRRFRKRLE
ncbi:MAG TPA: ABC transporter permease [Anaerolineae bacterium]|nr:ABC transporter permease [Anaerolineae bacterium]